MLKRVLAATAAGALMLGVAACGSDDSSSSGAAGSPARDGTADLITFAQRSIGAVT